MKREIFFDYCKWMFPILEEFDKNTDYSTYSKEALRTPGHLSERLLNIYLLHHKRSSSSRLTLPTSQSFRWCSQRMTIMFLN